jgi:hypothetical protein
MLETEHNFAIEVVPKIEGFWCNFLVYLIYIVILMTPFFIGSFFGWYLHSFWIGFLFLLFGILTRSVIISKMRINSIPFEQREMDYTTLAVVKWYVGKNKCI